MSAGDPAPPPPGAPDPRGGPTPPPDTRPYTLAQLTRYLLKLGATGFGGPVALVEHMHRDLVEHRRWISERDYDDGLTLAQLAPGPLAAQLAIYLGFVHYGILGATVAGVAFVLPSLVIVLAFSLGYVSAGGSELLQGAFYTTGAAIIGLIARSAQKLTRRTVGRDPLLIGIWVVLAAVTIITEQEPVNLVIAAGLLTWLLRSPPRPLRHAASTLLRRVRTLRPRQPPGSLALAPVAWLASSTLPAGGGGLLTQLALYFGQAGAFVFGSGLAIVPFLFGGVVTQRAWLTEQQFLDAVAVAMLTPGPVVITTAFIGYLVASLPGALIAAVATFTPAYLLTILPAPYLRRHRDRPGLRAAVAGVTAAAVGAIAGAVVILGQRSVTDPFTLAIAAATYLILVRFPRLPEPLVIATAAATGLALAMLAPTWRA